MTKSTEQISTSRGLRNNNPGNIRISRSVKYMGEIQPSQDRAFKQFSSSAWGYRAMFVLLHTYLKRYSLSTLNQLIMRYAPPNENHTWHYVESVAKECGIDPEAMIDTLQGTVMCPIVAAMSRVENGRKAVAEDVEQGWRLFEQFKP